MTREEALKVASEIHGWLKTDREKGALETLIPELKESEDERIRKWILEKVQGYAATGVPCSDEIKMADKAIDYLIKQKEQIPYTDFVIKPHKGDDNNPYDMRVSEAQEYAIKRGFGVPFNDGEVYVDERHMTQTIGNILRWADEHPKEQKPWKVGANAYFTPEQKPAEKHDLVAQLKEHLANATKEQLEAEWKELEHWNNIGPTVEEYFGSIKPAEWSEEDEKMLQSIIKDFRAGKVSTIGQEQWLKSLPERFNLQPKQEWSEEDIKKIRSEEYTKGFNDAAFGGKLKEWSEEDGKNILEDIIVFVSGYADKRVVTKWVSFLKSLRPVKQEWSKEDEDKLYQVMETLLADKTEALRETPHCKILHEAYDDMLAWLKSLSSNLKKKNEDVAKLCSNEWSEEDERKLQKCIKIVEGWEDDYDIAYSPYSNLLKSLCPHWKPSEEQMDSLRDTIVQTKGYSYSVYLPELYEQLKKL